MWKFILLLVMLLGLPWIGVICCGDPGVPYFEFPPRTRYVNHAPFSWFAFAGFATVIAAVMLPLLYQSFRNLQRYPVGRWLRYPFPWWGWLSVFACMLFWLAAWTRFSWFRAFQPHTFAPLWLSFIVAINALCVARTGKCMLIHRTRFFLLLFPVSAAFWWFFEYLNRFVQNWHYTGATFAPLQYFLLATFSFATVLPAVLGMQEFLVSFDWVRFGFANVFPIHCAGPKTAAKGMLSLAAAGLMLLGVVPDYLFPLLWISPLLIFVSLQTLAGERHVLSDISTGNWHKVVSFSMAALCCGFFWEMWNLYSLAKWEYSIPFVQRYPVFEMPLLGYAGYLPFGLECAVVGGILEKAIKNH